MTSQKKDIWLVSELFYPDDTSTGYIMTEIAKELSLYYQVNVLCASVYDEELKSTETLPENIKIHRISAGGLDKNKLIPRILRLLRVSFGMWIFGLKNFKNDQKVFLVTNPAFALPLFASLKTFKNFDLSVLVHDVFPENLIPGGVLKSKNQLSYKILERIFNWAYKKADKLLVLGRDMQSLIIKKTKKSVNEVKILQNWADVENIYPSKYVENKLVNKLNLNKKVVLLFAGNIGRLQGLNKLFEIIKQVKNPDLHYLFIGNGAAKNELIEYSKTNALSQITFLNAMPRSEQQVFLNACHFGFVTLDEQFIGLGVPSKSYNILAAGKPIFYLGNPETEIFQMIKEENCGVAFDPVDASNIRVFLESLTFENQGNSAFNPLVLRKIAISKYSKSAILNRFVKELSYE